MAYEKIPDDPEDPGGWIGFLVLRHDRTADPAPSRLGFVLGALFFSCLGFFSCVPAYPGGYVRLGSSV